MLSPLSFAVVDDVVTEDEIKGLINEILYEDDLVLTSETVPILQDKFQKWKEAFESK